MKVHGASLTVEGLRRRIGREGFELEIDHLHVDAGEVLAVLGPSGSGKSSLMEVLALLEWPDEGRLLVDGTPVDPSRAEMRLKMAAVFQRPYLFKGTVFGNVEYGLVARGVPATERRTRAAAALERVGLAGYGERSALTLSGGEAQRVSLARALVLEPQILLFDEPLASLDRPLRRKLIRDFARIVSEAGMTVVYITHDQDEALVLADRIAIMNGGRIVSIGKAVEIAGLAEDQWTADFLGVERAIEGVVVTSEQGLFVVESDGLEIAASGSVEVGAHVLVSVRPEDVLLFEHDSELVTTARNRIPGTILALEPHGATLRATLDCVGHRLSASVSHAAAAELRLAEGSVVLAVFKASAVQWRRAQESAIEEGVKEEV